MPLNCKWGSPISKMVLAPILIASVESSALKCRNDRGKDAKWNRPTNLVDDVSTAGASCSRDYSLIILTVTHAVLHSRNQLGVYQVIRHAAV